MHHCHSAHQLLELILAPHNASMHVHVVYAGVYVCGRVSVFAACCILIVLFSASLKDAAWLWSWTVVSYAASPLHLTITAAGLVNTAETS